MIDESDFVALEKKAAPGWMGPSRASVLFVAVVWAAILSLSIWLAHPPDASARLARLKQVVGEAERNAPKHTTPWEDPGAICTGAVDDVEAAMRSTLATAGLARSHIDVRADYASGQPGFERFAVEIVAKGAYPTVMRALVALEDARPAIFVRRLTLRTMSEDVVLGLDGAVLCRENPGAAP